MAKVLEKEKSLGINNAINWTFFLRAKDEDLIKFIKFQKNLSRNFKHFFLQKAYAFSLLSKSFLDCL